VEYLYEPWGWGAESKYFESVSCKIALPGSSHPMSSKNPDFWHFISLYGMNFVFV